jgi:hypothetical protein
MGHIEGYAIVSEDGMLADATGVMPEALKFEADARFFEAGLDGADVVVHGRHSEERQPRSHLRKRVVLTRRVSGIAPHPTNAMALLWNPAGASFAEALGALEAPEAAVGVIGGPDVFALFLDLFDAFHLSRARHVRLPGGLPVCPEARNKSPEEVLLAHGLVAGPTRILDPKHGLRLVSWRRPAG